MSEAKPILIIRIPMREAPHVSEHLKQVKEKVEDYHILIVLHDDEDVKFEGLYPKDFDEVEFKKLTEEVRESLEKVNG